MVLPASIAAAHGRGKENFASVNVGAGQRLLDLASYANGVPTLDGGYSYFREPSC